MGNRRKHTFRSRAKRLGLPEGLKRTQTKILRKIKESGIWVPRRTPVPAEKSWFNLRPHRRKVTRRPLELSEKTEIAYLIEYQDEAMEYLKNGDKYAGVSTGYKGVDTLLGSFLHRVNYWQSVAIRDTVSHYLPWHSPECLYQRTETRFTGKPRIDPLPSRTTVLQPFRQSRLRRDTHTEAPAVSYRDIDVLMQRAKDEGACMVVIDHFTLLQPKCRKWN